MSGFPTEAEFQRDCAERRMLRDFLSRYRGDTSSIQHAWLEFRAITSLDSYMGAAGDVKLAWDQAKKGPSVDELVKESMRLLKLCKIIDGFQEPSPQTVPNKFKYRAKGDVAEPSRLPAAWCLGDLQYDDGEALADAAARALEAQVEAERQKSKILNPKKVVDPDKKFTVI
jgi:hypothetical protein